MCRDVLFHHHKDCLTLSHFMKVLLLRSMKLCLREGKQLQRQLLQYSGWSPSCGPPLHVSGQPTEIIKSSLSYQKLELDSCHLKAICSDGDQVQALKTPCHGLPAAGFLAHIKELSVTKRLCRCCRRHGDPGPHFSDTRLAGWFVQRLHSLSSCMAEVQKLLDNKSAGKDRGGQAALLFRMSQTFGCWAWLSPQFIILALCRTDGGLNGEGGTSTCLRHLSGWLVYASRASAAAQHVHGTVCRSCRWGGCWPRW